ILHAAIPIPDKLHTTCHHIAFQIAAAVKTVGKTAKKPNMLITGGGAFNTFLIELLQNYLGETCEIVVPEPEVVSFKEALIFAFLGVLRWLNEVNCLSSVTGADKDNVVGAVYMA
ncbi:MAG TPA: anhydro-N-acetylmuramic acid kinase, partial [Flavisolibacter sp.]|nr:anhydro-N-acetylmuramic acid kinase [Flavisolibacter sp.]